MKYYIGPSTLDLILCRPNGDCADMHRVNLLFFSYSASFKNHNIETRFFILCVRAVAVYKVSYKM